MQLLIALVIILFVFFPAFAQLSWTGLGTSLPITAGGHAVLPSSGHADLVRTHVMILFWMHLHAYSSSSLLTAAMRPKQSPHSLTRFRLFMGHTACLLEMCLRVVRPCRTNSECNNSNKLCSIIFAPTVKVSRRPSSNVCCSTKSSQVPSKMSQENFPMSSPGNQRKQLSW